MRRALAYPARIPEAANGDFVVTFRDIPEAITGGATFIEAATQASDALRIAVAGLKQQGHEVPKPSPPDPGEHLVQLAP